MTEEINHEERQRIDIEANAKRVRDTLGRAYKVYGDKLRRENNYELVMLAVPMFPASVEGIATGIDGELLLDLLEVYVKEGRKAFAATSEDDGPDGQEHQDDPPASANGSGEA